MSEDVLANYTPISGNPSKLESEGIRLAIDYKETNALKTIKFYIYCMDTIVVIISIEPN